MESSEHYLFFTLIIYKIYCLYSSVTNLIKLTSWECPNYNNIQPWPPIGVFHRSSMSRNYERHTNFTVRLTRQQARISGLEHLGPDALAQVCAILPICDLSRLQQTNRGLRDVAAASNQWDLAATALETEYPLPEKCNEWRVEHDPRAAYTVEQWNALPPKRRFVEMIPMCILLVSELQAAAAYVGENYLSTFELYTGEDELILKHHKVYDDFKASGHVGDLAMLTAQSFFESQLRNAVHNGELAYDVEGMLVDYRSFPGGSGGRDAIIEMYYPPYFCNDIDGFDVLPGSTEHVEKLLDPLLPFSETERRLLGTDLVDSMRIHLEAPSWHTPGGETGSLTGACSRCKDSGNNYKLSCTFCLRSFCDNGLCIQACFMCTDMFCDRCSTLNYEIQSRERSICIDCSYNK